jgi:hypothetical protein
MACCSGESGWAQDTAKTEVGRRNGTWTAAGAQLMGTSVGRADLTRLGGVKMACSRFLQNRPKNRNPTGS